MFVLAIHADLALARHHNVTWLAVRNIDLIPLFSEPNTTCISRSEFPVVLLSSFLLLQSFVFLSLAPKLLEPSPHDGGVRVQRMPY